MKQSKEKRIIDHIRFGGTLTEQECVIKFGRSRLADIAHRARKRGINIVGRPIPGERHYYYSLEK